MVILPPGTGDETDLIKTSDMDMPMKLDVASVL